MNRYTDLWRKLDRIKAPLYEFQDPISQHQLIYGVGLVAHEFEGVQETVLQLFSVLCGTRISAWDTRLSRVLTMAASFSIKIKFCKEAAEQFVIEPDHRDAINKWLLLAERAASRRNDIVHGRVVVRHVGDSPPQALVVPPTFDRQRGGFLSMSDRAPAYSYNPQQVRDYADAIGRVNGNLITVTRRLAGEQTESEDEWMIDPKQLTQ